AIHKARRPVFLVAHSLACHLVSWWSEYEQPGHDGPVRGALLVAPPEVEKGEVDPRLARFARVLKNPLPFPSILAASRDDPYIGFDRARRLARIWKSRFVDAGWLGDRKSTRLNSSHVKISYAVFCLKKKKSLTISRPSKTPQHTHTTEQY